VVDEDTSLLAVIVLLVFYRYDGAILANASVDSFPAGCRRYLTVCGLGPSAVTHPETAATSPPAPPPKATSAGVDDRQASRPSKPRHLSAEAVVVTSAQIKHIRVPNAINSHGVIEWYV